MIVDPGFNHDFNWWIISGEGPRLCNVYLGTMCNYHIPPSYLRKALYIYTKDGIILLTTLDLHWRWGWICFFPNFAAISFEDIFVFLLVMYLTYISCVWFDLLTLYICSQTEEIWELGQQFVAVDWEVRFLSYTSLFTTISCYCSCVFGKGATIWLSHTKP